MPLRGQRKLKAHPTFNEHDHSTHVSYLYILRELYIEKIGGVGNGTMLTPFMLS
ncbi:7039_t:CDS:2 [Acaulospora morrowiae]|uniref:7039_t:CDS:1 n=1 Tax=Acaulospora morrowiae TaxID=94023 RepID=A0A9N8VF42_9GLOM|nr:7039_t:CDS:2 [Acaulospora morrowiae]